MACGSRAAGLAGGDDAGLVGERGEAGTVAAAKVLRQVADVGLGGQGADDEFLGDVVVAASAGVGVVSGCRAGRLSTRQLESILSFLLVYGRDRLAEVDHLDVEVGSVADKFALVIKAADSVAPMSAEEAARSLMRSHRADCAPGCDSGGPATAPPANTPGRVGMR